MDNSPHLGLIGLGTMGAALALNIAENGYPIAVYNRTKETTERFITGRGKDKGITACYSLEELSQALEQPRRIMLMIKQRRFLCVCYAAVVYDIYQQCKT